MGFADIGVEHRDPVLPAEGFGDGREVGENNRGCQIADRIGAHILLEEPHERDHLRIGRSQNDDLLAGAQNLFADVFGPRTPGATAAAVAEPVLRRLPQAEQPPRRLPCGIVLGLRHGQQPDEVAEMAAEADNRVVANDRVCGFLEKDRIDEQRHIYVKKRIDQPSIGEGFGSDPETGRKQDGVEDAGHGWRQGSPKERGSSCADAVLTRPVPR